MTRALRPGRQVVFQALEGEVVLLNLASGVYFSLNEVGASVWQLLVAGKTTDEIVTRLTADYRVYPEQAAQDVSRLIGELERHGLLES